MRILCFLLLFINTITNAQKFTISGKVNDSNLLPLVGASILVGDNKQGTSSDNSGQFSLNLEQGNYKLIISYTGYTSIEKEIGLEGLENIKYMWNAREECFAFMPRPLPSVGSVQPREKPGDWGDT